MYEDNPNPRDGSIPGCSSDYNSSISVDQLHEEDSSIASPANTEAIKKKMKSKLFENKQLSEEDSSVASSASKEAIKKKTINKSLGNMMKYADKLKQNYEESQEKIMRETHNYMKNLIELEQKVQKEIISNMLESQKNILKDTTNQLLTGLQGIFGVNRNQDIFPKTVSPQSFNFAPFSYVNSSYVDPQTILHSSNILSQTLQSSNTLSQTQNSSNTLPKVLVNLKRPYSLTSINEQHNTEKVQKIDPKQIKSISSSNTESTNTKGLKEHE